MRLHEAIAKGLILPLNDTYKTIELNIDIAQSELEIKQIEYKFIHDKIQQAAYLLIDPKEKAALHLKISRLLLKNITTEKILLKIFDLVNQYNKAIELITEAQEQNQLIKLNRQAAQKAKASAAYRSAFYYLQICLNLLPKDSWTSDFDLALGIYQEAAEAAYLIGDYSRMNVLTEIILQRTAQVLDKVVAYEIRIKACFARGDLEAGIRLSLGILKLLGFNFPHSPDRVQVYLSLLKTRFNLSANALEKLPNLPKMTDNTVIAAMRIIQFISIAVYMSNPNLYILMSLKRIDLSLRYGNAYESAIAYTAYAWIVAAISKDISTGYKLGKLSYELVRQFGDRELEPCILFLLNTFIFPYKQHLRKIFPDYITAYQKGLEVGDLMHASSSITYYIIYAYFSGQKIPEIERKAANFYQRLLDTKQLNFINLFKLYRQVCINLASGINLEELAGEYYNEDAMFPLHQQTSDGYAIYNLYLQKAILCYVFQSNRIAWDNIGQARRIFNETMGQVLGSILCTYESLIALSVYSSANKNERARIRQKVNSNQKIMKYWADYAPMNYLHKYYLVKAEKEKVFSNSLAAIDLYDRAIELAHEHQYIQEEALAYELAAKFYLTRNNKLIAATYMKQARFCYLNWGAKAKVEQLDKQYPELLATVEHTLDSNIIDTTISSEDKHETLDLLTLIKTSQALSQTKDLARLTITLIQFVLENSGAETGSLILAQSDNLTVYAKGIKEGEILTTSIDKSQNLCQTIINYVYRTEQQLVLADAARVGLFINDEYISNNNIKSVLCLPILNRGRLIGILYLENNLAKNTFSTERVEVIKLISSQAAISIENALLRENKRSPFEYQIGGSLTIGAPTYVVRQADSDLYKYLKQGQYCYILNSRHTGKSSLCIRTMNELKTEGYVCAVVDLTSIGSKNITVEQWYAGVIYSLTNNLQLSTKLNFRDWWRSLDFLSPPQRFNEFIQQILLPKISGKIVIFIDEIDSTLGLNFNLDDFFAAIRYCYNNRANDPNYQRLSFVLLGVASPSNLVRDKNCTPFNIGRAIALQGFQLHQVEPLIAGLTERCSNPEAAIAEILAWTNGQPFLTQKICNLIAETQINIPAGEEAAWVKQLIQERMIDNWEAQDDPQHFKTIGDRLLNSQSNSTHLLQLYKQILQQGNITADGSNTQQELLLSGLVRQNRQKLQTYNRIYQSVFDLDWCDRHLNKKTS